MSAFSCLLRIAIVCVMLEACADVRTDDGSGDDPASLPGELEGSWRWVGSTGGAMAHEVSPRTSEREYVVGFTSDRRYRERSSKDMVPFDGVFSLVRGVTFEPPLDTVPLLQLPRPLFGGYFSPANEFAIGIRGDSLELVEWSLHPWTHRFLRITADSADAVLEIPSRVGY